MNKINKTLLSLLASSINGDTINNIELSLEEWNQLYLEALSHQVHLILYPVCKKIFESNPQLTTIDNKWKKIYLIHTLNMNDKLSIMQDVLKAHEVHNIKVMVLKGLYIKELYKYPETRTMGDVDLYISSDDLELSTSILLDMGYQLITDKESTIHYTFQHERYIDIELHYLIIGKTLHKSAKTINNTIWENTQKYCINNSHFFIPTHLYHMVYSCLHMAKHFKNCGFGLRQLYDFVILINNVDIDFNWDEFLDIAESYGVGKFTGSLIIICHNYFMASVPSQILSKLSYDNNYIQLLLDEILISGVFGLKSNEHASNVSLANYKYNEGKTKGNSKLSYYFPSIEHLRSRYNYAKKYPVLLPIAWIHRIIFNILRSDLSLSAKTPNNDIINDRINLLNWLDIKN